MEKYDLILFDLDGTLTDSGPGIMNAVRYALNKLGEPALGEATLRRFIGPPLYESFERFAHMTHERALTAVDTFREYYKETGVFENSVYPGVPEMLSGLRQAGYMLAVATSKPETAAYTVLRHFDLEKYFSVIVGALEDGTRITKSDVVALALEKAAKLGKSRAIMVGDREHDILGAREHGLDTVAVLYGYGSREEFAAAGAYRVAETPAEVVRLLCTEKRP